MRAISLHIESPSYLHIQVHIYICDKDWVLARSIIAQPIRPVLDDPSLHICYFEFCLRSMVNSSGHIGTVSYPNHTFPGQA